MLKNTVLAKLRAGQPSYGLWLTLGSPVVAEELAQPGIEWALIDTQHGYFSHEALLATIQLLSHTSTVPLARPAANDPALIGRLLDMGALGVVVPLVNTREDAERAVAAVRYPPQGKRSAGGSRLLLYGQDYFSAANPEIFLAVMLETQQAVDNADTILSVPGIDAVYIGPGDLALDLGTFGQQSDRHEAALQTVLQAGQRHGIPVGLACGSLDVARRRAEQGFRFLDIGGDLQFLWHGLRETHRRLADLP